jgi:hypothetical protein
MLLALFLIELAAGLYLFLPLVGRRNAGVKFYRMVLLISGALVLGSLVATRNLASGAVVILALTVVVWFVLRYPKRFIFRFAAALLAAAYAVHVVLVYDAAVRPRHIAWSIAGALAATALLGSVNLAMTLGHWYLVVRGMPIEPLKRLTIATLFAAIARVLLVVVAIAAGGVFHEVAVRHGIFFWMRAGWGLAGPLVLYPMVWGTVKIRSTMAATGILYVDVVAVIIGEVLGGWLSAMVRMPV